MVYIRIYESAGKNCKRAVYTSNRASLDHHPYAPSARGGARKENAQKNRAKDMHKKSAQFLARLSTTNKRHAFRHAY